MSAHNYQQDFRVLRALSSLVQTGHLALLDDQVGDLDLKQDGDQIAVNSSPATLKQARGAVAEWYEKFDAEDFRNFG